MSSDMMLANSQNSAFGGSVDGPNNSADVLSEVSDGDQNVNAPMRRRRGPWSFFGRGGRGDNRNDDRVNTNERQGSKGLSVSCRVSNVQAPFLITCLSLFEMIGNPLALVYGVVFIQGAINFYDLDTNTDPEKKAKEYDEKLERVLFLEKNRVGFIGLLATCLVGLIVAILMPIGAIYKSWKSLRAAMSLLFSMCLAHMILASIFLTDSKIMASVAVIPFRIFEILLIYKHISLAKAKKREQLLRAASDAPARGSACAINGQSQKLIMDAGAVLNDMQQNIPNNMRTTTTTQNEILVANGLMQGSINVQGDTTIIRVVSKERLNVTEDRGRGNRENNTAGKRGSAEAVIRLATQSQQLREKDNRPRLQVLQDYK